MAGQDIYAPRQARHRRTWTLAAIVLLLAFGLAGQFLGVIPGIFLGLIGPDATAPGWVGMSYILIAGFAGTALLIFGWVWLFERRSAAAIGLNARFPVRFLRGYGLGLGFLAAVVAIIWALGGYQVEQAGSLAIASLIPLAWLMAGFVIQGSTEELMFRGWLMGLIASRHGIWLAILINSALFGLVHAGNIAWSQELMFGLANIVLVGVFLSLYAAKEGSLWGVCGWHAAWNWLLASGFGLPVSGQDVLVTPFLIDLADTPDAAWWLTGGVFGPEASVVTSAVLLAGVIALLLRGRFARHAVPVTLPEPTLPEVALADAALPAGAPGAAARAFTGDIPQHYDTGLGPILFADYARDIASRAAALKPSSVLELAAGTGIVSRALRDALPRETSLLVTDLNAPMLEIARAKFQPGEGVELRPADAMALPFQDARFDQIVCQFGVMFFPGKVEAFTEARRVLRPGGALVFSVWGAMENNPFSQMAHETVAEIFPDNPPGFYRVPFSYCDPVRVSADLAAAGFVDIRHDVVGMDKQMSDFAPFARGLVLGNPLVEEIRQRGGISEQAVVERFTLALRQRFGSEPAHMPLEAIVFSARKPQ